jgi:hypothetical protein
MVLKLFDRRFAASDRVNWGIDPWTPKVEAEYQEFLRHEDSSGFLHELQSVSDRDDLFDLFDREGEAWDVAQKEAFFDHEMKLLYETEKEVHRRVHELQGRDIPRLLLHVSLLSSSGFQCQGILLEFIPGFSLADLAYHAPRNTASTSERGRGESSTPSETWVS